MSLRYATLILVSLFTLSAVAASCSGGKKAATVIEDKPVASTARQDSAAPAATVKVRADTGAAKGLVAQTTCPVMGNPINKKLYVDYKGKRIYVCCSMCLGQVKADPEKWIKKLAEMGQKPDSI
jgi:YHS domain-containing protein